MSLNLGLACSKSNCRNDFSYCLKRDPAITISRPYTCGLMKTLGKYTVRPCGCSLISCNQCELTEKTIRKHHQKTILQEGCSELIVVQRTKKLNSKFCETALTALKFCSYSYTIPTDKKTDKRKNYWINQTFNKDSFDETEFCHPLQRPCIRLKHRFTIMIISISIVYLLLSAVLQYSWKHHPFFCVLITIFISTVKSRFTMYILDLPYTVSFPKLKNKSIPIGFTVHFYLPPRI